MGKRWRLVGDAEVVCPLLLDGARDGSRALENEAGSRPQETKMRDAVAAMGRNEACEA